MKNKQQKVYCLDCEFYWVSRTSLEEYCRASANCEVIGDTYLAEKIKEILKPKEKNANNNCGDFSSRLYKGVLKPGL